MVTKRNQHFVPRFYLRYFSTTKNKRTIGIFNIGKEIFIPFGSIKDQACSEYFYGKDNKVEENLSIIEENCAIIISKIIETNILPNYRSEEHLLLLIFIISLSSRTEYAADSLDEAFDKMNKIIFKNDPRFKDILNDIKIGIQNAGAYSLGIALQVVPVTFDLEFKLLLNKTSTPFITSDNPVIKYNQFLEHKKAYGGITGLGVMGIQIILPLNPYLYIIFYDQGIYKIGNRKQRVLEVHNIKEIDSLNLLQFINADENIYFNDCINQIYLGTLLTQGKKFRRERKVNVNEYISNKEFSNRQSSIIHTYSEEIKINLSLSFISLIKKAKKYKLDNKAIHIRNERVSKIYDLINKEDEILYEKYRNKKNR